MLGRTKKDEVERLRRHRRLQTDSVAIVSWGEGQSARKVSGRCSDISESGARIETSELVPPGTRVALQLPDLSAEAYGVVRNSGSGLSWGRVFATRTTSGGAAGTSRRVSAGRPISMWRPPYVLVLVAAVLYTVPGLVPEWVPFSPPWARRASLTPASFSLGSSKSDVYGVQGPPMRMTDTVWHYGPSRVYFRGDAVIGWSVSSGTPLRLGMSEPEASSDQRKRFTVGSTPERSARGARSPNGADGRGLEVRIFRGVLQGRSGDQVERGSRTAAQRRSSKGLSFPPRNRPRKSPVPYFAVPDSSDLVGSIFSHMAEEMNSAMAMGIKGRS